jgi:hypothetical protein
MRWTFVLALLAGLALPHAAAAFGSCADTAYVARFEGSVAGASCEVRERFTLRHGRGTSNVRVVSFTSDSHADDAAWIDRVRRNLTRIGEKMASMGRVGTDDITILLASAPSAEGWEAEAYDLVGEDGSYLGECAVTVYKVPAGYDERHFDFLLAHELFHCAQNVSFPGAGTGGDWWTEGSAEHFAHMVVPDAGDFGWYAAFDSQSANKTLTAMTYENVVFFHWLQQQDGVEGVTRFLSSIPLGGDEEAALRARMDTAAMAAFAEDYLEGRIQSPGGAQVPAPQAFTEDVSVGDTADLPIEIAPLALQRYRVRFDKERHFRVELSGAEGADVRMQDDSSAWSNLPLQLSTCPDAVTRLAYAVTSDGPGEGTMQVIKEGVDGPGACCLEGKWTATPETLAGLAEFGNEVGGPAVAAAGGDMSCAYAGGEVILTFAADATGSLAFDGHATECVATMQGQSMVTTGTRSGSFAFDWITKSNEAGQAGYRENSVVWTMDIRIGPIVQSMTRPDSGPSTEANGFAFTCTPTTLDILGIYGLSHKENRFTRPPPPPDP